MHLYVYLLVRARNEADGKRSVRFVAMLKHTTVIVLLMILSLSVERHILWVAILIECQGMQVNFMLKQQKQNVLSVLIVEELYGMVAWKTSKKDGQ